MSWNGTTEAHAYIRTKLLHLDTCLQITFIIGLQEVVAHIEAYLIKFTAIKSAKCYQLGGILTILIPVGNTYQVTIILVVHLNNLVRTKVGT